MGFNKGCNGGSEEQGSLQFSSVQLIHLVWMKDLKINTTKPVKSLPKINILTFDNHFQCIFKIPAIISLAKPSCREVVSEDRLGMR